MFSSPASEGLAALSPAELRTHCAQRTMDAADAHEPFCFELCRRAIVAGDQVCWEQLYDHYRFLVRGWVYQGGGERLAQTEVDELVLCAFTKLWRFYTATNLAEAHGLASVLNYLKSCAITCVQEARRAQQHRQLEDPVDDFDTLAAQQSVVDSVLGSVASEQLWQIVLDNCHEARDGIVARLSFLDGLKPAAIYDHHPEQFVDVDEVYRIKRNLLSRLERNAVLRAWWDSSNA